MKVAYVMHGIGWGGAAGSLLLLLKSLGNNVEKFFFTTIDRDLIVRDEFIKNTSYFKQFSIAHMYNDQAGGTTSENQFNKIINTDHTDFVKELIKQEIDILHVNSIVLSHIIKEVKENSNIKVVVHVCELIPKYGNGKVQEYLISNIYKYSDGIICISDNEAKPFKEHKNLWILANPFDFKQIEDVLPYNLRSKYNLPKESLLIAMGGQFSKSKGQLDFLKSARNLLKDHPELIDKVFFVVMGVSFNPLWKRLLKRLIKRTDFGQYFLDFIKQSDYKRNLLFLPFMYTKEYFQAISEIDIFVRPSLAGDPWGRDIIEAMAFSKPIIATCDSTFFVKPNKTGILVPLNSSDKISHALFDLVSNRKKELNME